MEKIDIHIEKWVSSENNEEIHFFIEGTQTYLGGFNPKLISTADFVSFLDSQGYNIKI